MLRPLIYLLLALAITGGAEEGTSRQWIWSGGQWRTYLLHVPPAASPTRALPLVVVYHGFSGAAESMEDVTGFSPMADRERFVVAYPDALYHPEMGGNSWLTPTGELADGNGAFIGDMVAAVRARVAIDRRRIFATGMSQGGGMSYFSVIGHPDVFAAIAPVVVSLPTALDLAALLPGRPVPVLMINGTQDNLIPYHGGLGVNNVHFRPTPALASIWATHDQCFPYPMTWNLPNWNWFDGCTASVTQYFWGAQGSEVVLYTIHGGGHTWPASRVWLPAFIFGNTCQDFDGTRAIWDFFVRHPLPAGVVN